MKKLYLLFVLMVIPAVVFTQDYTPMVFPESYFESYKNDTPVDELGTKANFLPLNLPFEVKSGQENQWWSVGDEYIPRNWLIPSQNLNIGSWFGWYLHRSDRALNRSATEQINVLPVPDRVKKYFLEQKVSAGVWVDNLVTGTFVDAMVFVSQSKGGLVCPNNCVWLGDEILMVHLYPLVQYNNWVYQLGYVFDCNNHFYFKWKSKSKSIQTTVYKNEDAFVSVTEKKNSLSMADNDTSTGYIDEGFLLENDESVQSPRYVRSWVYAGLGRNWVVPHKGVEHTWKYTGVDLEFLPVHWFSLNTKAVYLQSSDHYWGVDNKICRPLIGFAFHHPRWTLRSMWGRDYNFKLKNFAKHWVVEENLEIYPFRRTNLRGTLVYKNKPGDDYDHVWAQSEVKYALSIAHNNVRKWWLGFQLIWSGQPYWEKEIKGEHKHPDYTTCAELMTEVEFGQRRDVVLKLTGGRGSKSVGWCGSVNVIIRLL
ncbi:MAG: hypothetical protein ABIF17_04860 [Patescibacteria group bacterium]